MGQREFTVDTRQLERLSGALAALPKDVNAALVSSLRSAALKSLRTTVAKYYALDLKKLSGTYRISRRAVSSADGTSVAYEIYGRRLTPAHFIIDPMRHRAVRPTLEIIRGHRYQASDRVGTDGKTYAPFVMRLKGSKAGNYRLNVFRGVGGKTGTGKPKLHAYRTVSVPQMLGNEMVAGEVQTELLSVFDRVLLPRIEKRLDLTAEAVVKG